MNRTIIIGDLHGCYDEARALLDRLAVTESDRVIFAGDLVDRGPKQRECVELAMKHEAVLGNHEEKHLMHRSLPEHAEYFRKLPKFIRILECNAVVLHAGVLPNVPIEKQEPYHLLHAQCVRPPEKKSFWPSKAPSTHTFWTNHWRGPERVVFGHTVVDKPLVTPFAVGIDTGCAFGGALTAVVLPTWEIVSVPSLQPKRSGRDVATYRIHGDVKAYS
jgi:serine/threonine protein phosphatase 1